MAMFSYRLYSQPSLSKCTMHSEDSLPYFKRANSGCRTLQTTTAMPTAYLYHYIPSHSNAVVAPHSLSGPQKS